MHERTKEVDTLRKLAELLRQANSAATGGGPKDKKRSPGIKKIRRGDADKDPVRPKP